jgi:hypothetical protein
MLSRFYSTTSRLAKLRPAMSFKSLVQEAMASGKKVIAVDADDVLCSTNAKVAESKPVSLEMMYCHMFDA